MLTNTFIYINESFYYMLNFAEFFLVGKLRLLSKYLTQWIDIYIT